MRKLLAVVLVAGAGLVVPATAASAGPVPSVNPHRHYILSPNGDWIEVGPSTCDNPNAKNGFDRFHAHVHFGRPQTVFANDGHPIELVARGCSFVP